MDARVTYKTHIISLHSSYQENLTAYRKNAHSMHPNETNVFPLLYIFQNKLRW